MRQLTIRMGELVSEFLQLEEAKQLRFFRVGNALHQGREIGYPLLKPALVKRITLSRRF